MVTSAQLPAVAQKIYIECKKCGVERYHVVLAHTKTDAAKVECEVCHKKSTYKLAGAKKKTAVKKTKAEKKIITRWDEVKDMVNEGEKRPYNMKISFSKDMTIDHPKFGLGVVISTQAQSIEVVFPDGSRSLVHNRQ